MRPCIPVVLVATLFVLVPALASPATALSSEPAIEAAHAASTVGVTDFVHCITHPVIFPEWPVQMCVVEFLSDIG